MGTAARGIRVEAPGGVGEALPLTSGTSEGAQEGREGRRIFAARGAEEHHQSPGSPRAAAPPTRMRPKKGRCARAQD